MWRHRTYLSFQLKNMPDTQSKTIYLLDTNILIGFSTWAPISFFNDFWSKLADSLANGDWILLDVVVDEILYDKDLKSWCGEQKRKGRVRPIDDDHRNRAAEINNEYKMIDDITQNSKVDPYLIAYAEVNKLCVVTREIRREKQGDLYKIPDVCKKFGVNCIQKPKVFLAGIGL